MHSHEDGGRLPPWVQMWLIVKSQWADDEISLVESPVTIWRSRRWCGRRGEAPRRPLRKTEGRDREFISPPFYSTSCHVVSLMEEYDASFSALCWKYQTNDVMRINRRIRVTGEGNYFLSWYVVPVGVQVPFVFFSPAVEIKHSLHTRRHSTEPE